jgi:hypothetical protein
VPPAEAEARYHTEEVPILAAWHPSEIASGKHGAVQAVIIVALWTSGIDAADAQVGSDDDDAQQRGAPYLPSRSTVVTMAALERGRPPRPMSRPPPAAARTLYVPRGTCCVSWRPQSWLGLSEQVFRLDRWSIYRVQAAAICGSWVK